MHGSGKPAFTLHNPAGLAGPAIIAVPHAGRDYAPELLVRARAAPAELQRLEDRLADQLVSPLVAAGRTVLIAHHPRASIDLNRSEAEVDAAMVEGMPPAGLNNSARVRGGLGLVPRRLVDVGELWRGRLPRAELERRIVTVHRPYHAALGAALADARAGFGVAVLIDLHSMPPLGRGEADIVLGDRFGSTADAPLVNALAAAARARGLKVARNAPYAGGHILARHAVPRRGIHAIQVEIDRRLYLCDRLEQPGAGFADVAALVTALVIAADAAVAPALPIAAE